VLSKRITLFALALVTVAALAGCGSSSKKSDSSSTTSPAAGDKAALCADNAKITEALQSASTADDALQVFKDNESTINDFAAKAPAEVKEAAQTQANAALDAIKNNDSSKIENAGQDVQDASEKVDTFCGQSTTTTVEGGESTDTTVASSDTTEASGDTTETTVADSTTETTAG
jgi:hypothetical protein